LIKVQILVGPSPVSAQVVLTVTVSGFAAPSLNRLPRESPVRSSRESPVLRMLMLSTVLQIEATRRARIAQNT
jgi:hypothetical protein